jgi:hypothetical protein
VRSQSFESGNGPFLVVVANDVSRSLILNGSLLVIEGDMMFFSYGVLT